MSDPGDEHFLHRGVIEGYYGPPYASVDRLWLVEQLGRWGMNRYVYAPKHDALQREQWRTPYDDAAMRDFGELVGRGAKAGVEVGFAVSPGLSMEYASREDRAALTAKLRRFRELGARFFALALDDVPSRLVHAGDQAAFANLAEAHVAVAHELRDALGPEVWLWLVPTDYVGVEATDYLETLGAGLDASIEVAWTGRTIVSPTIRSEEAQRRAATLRRPLLLWDNVPVSDGPMRPMLHLGPYAGRDAGLPQHVSGILLNTMQHARASAVAARTAADYLRDPASYAPERAWRTAVEELGAGAPEAFRSFAEGHRFSPLHPTDRDRELEAAFAELRDATRSHHDEAARLEALLALLEARAGAAQTLRSELEDRRLAQELEPWLASHGDESARMLRAVELLQVLASDSPAMEKLLAFFRFESGLASSPGTSASYGPRRVLYPQLANLRDDAASFGDDRALFLDCCLTDEMLRFAEERALTILGDR